LVGNFAPHSEALNRAYFAPQPSPNLHYESISAWFAHRITPCLRGDAHSFFGAAIMLHESLDPAIG
jgi:hypothetical protein